MDSPHSHQLPSSDHSGSGWSDTTVVLGGGGARGLAHLGAMRAIGQSGRCVGRLVGVSMGALMASLCAVERDVQQAESIAREFLTSERYRTLQKQVIGGASGASSSDRSESGWSQRWRTLLWARRAIARAARDRSLLPSLVLDTIVESLIPDILIEDLSTPLHLIAVDLKSGERVVISSGPLRSAVTASMSIPGVFPPVLRDHRELSDVGVYDAVPCDLVRQLMNEDQGECDLIVVDVSRSESTNAACRTALQSVLRFQELAEQRIREHQLALADIVIRPQLGSVAWFDFTRPDPLIEAGYEEARVALMTKPHPACRHLASV